jgi:hypothetical protein
MRDETTRDAYGETTVRVVADVVLELYTRDHVSRANATKMFDRATALVQSHPELRAALFETTDHTSHDPGNLAMGIRWFQEHGAHLSRVAIVTRSHGLATMSNIGRVMLPRIDVAVFNTREEAISWCAAAAPSEAPVRHRTGKHRRPNAA